MRALALPLLLLVACDPQKIDVGDDTAAGTDDTGGHDDTAPDDDTDTADDTDEDTDTAVDTETGTGPTSTLTFVVDGGSEADQVQLDWLDEEFAVVGRAGGAAIAGGTVSVEVPDPDTSELLEVSPGLYARYAIPYAYVDADGDGIHADDEEIRAVGAVWPLYLTGNIPAEYGALGIVDGWNAVWVQEGGDVPELADIDAIPLPTNLAPLLEAALGGTVGVELGENPQLALIPSVAFEGAPFGSLLYNQGLDATWEIAVAGAPPFQHVTDLSGTGFYAAIEVPVAFDDADSDGFPGGSDTLLGPACAGGNVAALFWMEPPTDPTIAYYFATEAVTPGWMPVRADASGDFVPLTEDEAAGLVIGDGCSFE